MLGFADERAQQGTLFLKNAQIAPIEKNSGRSGIIFYILDMSADVIMQHLN